MNGICRGGLPTSASLNTYSRRPMLLSALEGFSLVLAVAPQQLLVPPPHHSFVFEFVCLPWSEVCSARVTILLMMHSDKRILLYSPLHLFTNTWTHSHLFTFSETLDSPRPDPHRHILSGAGNQLQTSWYRGADLFAL